MKGTTSAVALRQKPRAQNGCPEGAGRAKEAEDGEAPLQSLAGECCDLNLISKGGICTHEGLEAGGQKEGSEG